MSNKNKKKITKELEMIIMTTEDGIYLSYMPKTNEHYTNEGFLNRRFDNIEITITRHIDDTLKTK